MITTPIGDSSPANLMLRPFREFASLQAPGGILRVVASIVALCRDLGIPENLREYGLKEEHVPFVLKNCRSNSMRGNPVYVTDDDVIAFLQALL